MKPYTVKALSELCEHTKYETWLLEEVYKIMDMPLTYQEHDVLYYALNGPTPLPRNYFSAHIEIGDWRPAFQQVGAPLVFVTSFKLLDMLFEWVLSKNGIEPTFRFKEKIKALDRTCPYCNKSPITFPLLIEDNIWLRDRLIALYKNLEPLRGEIIHNNNFKTENGTLLVSRSKKGNVGPTVKIEPKDIRSLAFVLVTVLKYLADTWRINSYKERMIRFNLDELRPFHKLQLLHKWPPLFVTIRQEVLDEVTIEFNLERIRNDIAKWYKNYEVVFDVRIISIDSDGTQTAAYVIPWEQHRNVIGPQFRMTHEELAIYEAPLPAEMSVG